ncbi:pseudouridylate synthase [Mucilaginibacter hurinus]|uniref:Pseudouridine synthase n=1 Tax=Mucilaginibacter hurinus TaxID=2201324 RepID=A0A367GLR4_9SPHI|nr:pseudouridine synthase [Mucilaginibacter hurinus]RCH54417.1 pseudouridylate synthase [Mucilaginibacter hurinus]
MVFKKPRNSRDDKSAGAPKGRSKGGESTKRTSAPPRGKFTSDGTDNPKKKFDNDKSGEKRSSFSAVKRPYSGRPADGERAKKNFGNDANRPRRNFDDKPAGDKRPYSGRASDTDRPKRTFGDDRSPATSGKNFGDRPKRSYSESGDKKFNRRPAESGFKKRATGGYDEKPYAATRQKRDYTDATPGEAPARNLRERKKNTETKHADKGLIRLNRYIANAGICSRRKADELIEAGVVSVNGQVVSELGYKVDPAKDEVKYNNETLKREKNVYVLLNKPKDYITTTDDPQERRTVMHLVEKASKERIYPIGRLDRNTTGLLLMTNDGDLADKLSHPRSNIVKLYQVELSKGLTQGDLNKIAFGLELEDGIIKPDSISYVAGGTKREVGIQIHSGKNRIVRRIFEHLGYEVVKLDRVVYAGLTKKDLPRGRWRYLEEKEVIQLKHLI